LLWTRNISSNNLLDGEGESEGEIEEEVWSVGGMGELGSRLE
jgi:hypothetical protein